MKVIDLLPALSILFFAACQKKDTIVPATKYTAPTVDTARQVLTPFVPFTDTFYGKIYEGDIQLPSFSDSFAYIYAYHPAPDSIIFSTSGAGKNYSGQYYAPGTVDDPYCVLGFNEKMAINDSNHYSWVYKFSNYSLRFTRDSLYYNSANDYPESMDTYLTYIAGKRTGGANTRH